MKAIKGLGEVSSVVCMKHNTGVLGDVWVASNRHVRLNMFSEILYVFDRPCSHCLNLQALHFAMDTEKMVLAKADATLTLELGADDDDVLNEVEA